MNSGTYRTRQKQEILDVLVKFKDKQLSADDILGKIKQEGKQVGKTTIYRNLDRLVAEKSVRKFYDDELATAFYQYVEDPLTCESHFHLKCSDCGALIHLECQQLNEIANHVLKDHNFHINNEKTVFYGQCKECYKKTLSKD